MIYGSDNQDDENIESAQFFLVYLGDGTEPRIWPRTQLESQPPPSMDARIFAIPQYTHVWELRGFRALLVEAVASRNFTIKKASPISNTALKSRS